ncbi:MAG TPA: zf-HC2 domain-containing protein, partial [Chloroflexota bacterium]
MQTDHLTTEQLSASLDGQLSENERSIVEEHLASCPECLRELDELRQTVTLLRALPAAVPPRSIRIYESGEVPRRASQPWALPTWLRAMGGAAAAFMVVLWAADAMPRAAQLSPATSSLQGSSAVSLTPESAFNSAPAPARFQTQPTPAPAAPQAAADSAAVRSAPSAAGAVAGAAPPNQTEGSGAQPAAKADTTAHEPVTPAPLT